MAEAIVASGYRNIAFLGTQMPNDFRAKKRLEGFEEALRRAGLSLVDREFYDGGSAPEGREMTAAVLRRSPQVDFLLFQRWRSGRAAALLSRSGDRRARARRPCRVQRG